MQQRFDLLAFSILLLVVVLAVFTGVAGSVFSEVEAKGIYEILKDWQTLIASIIALVAAYIAVKPSWQQVRIMGAQASTDLFHVAQKEADELKSDLEAIGHLWIIHEHVDRCLKNAHRTDREFKFIISTIVTDLMMVSQGLSNYDGMNFFLRPALSAETKSLRDDLNRVTSKLGKLCARLLQMSRPQDASQDAHEQVIADRFKRDIQSLFPDLISELVNKIMAAEHDVNRSVDDVRTRMYRLNVSMRQLSQ